MRCLKCSSPVKVEPRANEFIAYCTGSEGWNGCCAEFGITKTDAMENLAALGSAIVINPPVNVVRPPLPEHEKTKRVNKIKAIISGDVKPVEPVEETKQEEPKPVSTFVPPWERR